MLTVSTSGITAMGRSAFLRRLDDGLKRSDTVWAEVPADERREFLEAAWARADELGLRSERGVAAYALAAWWRGLGFERDVPLLLALLAAPLPEVRKIHGMNEWVHDQLRPDATPESGDAAIRRSFAVTEPWGRL